MDNQPEICYTRPREGTLRQALDMPGEAHISVLLADRLQDALWRERGVDAPVEGVALASCSEQPTLDPPSLREGGCR